MAVIAVADMYGVSGRRDELAALLAGEQDATAGRPGCRRYDFAAALADHDHFVLVSEWDDEAALEAHYASEGFASFQFALQGLLARPSEMRIFTVTGELRPVPSAPMDPRDAD
jgi:quinol monooxygenase YgiN